jgi:hypothetical protein
MRLLRGIFGGNVNVEGPREPSVVLSGEDDLEVVGESFHQDALRSIVPTGGERVRMPVKASLVAERHNPTDPNAIAVWVQGSPVGHLSREDAAILRQGLLDLERQHGASIQLRGMIVGGGDGRPSYGVFLRYPAAAFGVVTASAQPARHPTSDGSIRTGFHVALANDAADDDYDLGWQAATPDDPIAAIAYLRSRLAAEREPLSRHFLFASLAAHLYSARGAFASALQEFDEVCRRHDAEMDVIRQALIRSFGGVPLIELYRQASIRHQKAHDWETASWWARRGLEVYGLDAINVEVTTDLARRLANYRAKLDPSPRARRATPATSAQSTVIPSVETLACQTCGSLFERQRTRGRKPTQCPACRGAR